MATQRTLFGGAALARPSHDERPSNFQIQALEKRIADLMQANRGKDEMILDLANQSNQRKDRIAFLERGIASRDATIQRATEELDLYRRECFALNNQLKTLLAPAVVAPERVVHDRFEAVELEDLDPNQLRAEIIDHMIAAAMTAEGEDMERIDEMRRALAAAAKLAQCQEEPRVITPTPRFALVEVEPVPEGERVPDVAPTPRFSMLELDDEPAPVAPTNPDAGAAAIEAMAPKYPQEAKSDLDLLEEQIQSAINAGLDISELLEQQRMMRQRYRR